MSHCENQPSDRLNVITISVLFLFLVLLKGWDRLYYAGIWAEDGSLFLTQAFESGWFSVFIPYDGYFHTLPRIIAIISTWLPVKAIPYFIVLMCYGIFTSIICLIFTHPYRWLFRKRILALIAGVLLLVSPGQIEILGNLASLHWYLLLLLSILGLKNLDNEYSIYELIAAFLCVSTTGASIILTPLFVLRAGMKWTEQKKSAYSDLCIVFFILFFSLINIFISSGPSLFYYPLSIYTKIYINHFVHFFIFHPFVGDGLTMLLHHHKMMAYTTTTIIVLLIALNLRTKWERQNALILMLCFCSLFLPVIIAMARPINILTLLSFSNYDMHHWFRSRYSFYIPTIASLFWVFFISRINKPIWLGSVMIVLILFSQLFSNRYRIELKKYRNYNSWQKNAEILEESIQRGCPRTVRIAIDPKGWYFNYQSPLKTDCNTNKGH